MEAKYSNANILSSGWNIFILYINAADDIIFNVNIKYLIDYWKNVHIFKRITYGKMSETMDLEETFFKASCGHLSNTE